MENKGLIFNKGITNSVTITIENLDAVELNKTIDALLDCICSMPDDLQGCNERYYICNVIRSLIPSGKQMKQLEEIQNQIKKVV